MERSCNVIYALMADDLAAGQDRTAVRASLDRALSGVTQTSSVLPQVSAPSPTIDRETWGTGPEAQRGLHAALRVASRASR
jgi:hypothetical protein